MHLSSLRFSRLLNAQRLALRLELVLLAGDQVSGLGILHLAVLQNLGKLAFDLHHLAALDGHSLTVHVQRDVILVLFRVLEQLDRYQLFFLLGLLGKTPTVWGKYIVSLQG